jgi:AcrR family transcriptional regulator
MKGTTRRLRGFCCSAHILALTDRTTERAQRRPEEKRARLLAAARSAFGKRGYGASVHEICQAAGVGIGTFYHQFPDKSDLMRVLMDEEHQYRIRAFDALAADNLAADDLAAEITRVLAGSDPALLRAMIEACGIDERLRDFGRELRKETRERLAAALARARQAREIRRPALDASTAAWATLVIGDAAIDPAGIAVFEKAIAVLAFAEGDGATRAGA